jgi:cytochrome c oxidase subunit 2
VSRHAQTGRIQRHPSAPQPSASLAAALPRPLRFAAFAAIALLVATVAIGLVVGRLAGPAATDATAIGVRASMGGFDPGALSVKPGELVRIELTSLDTSFHSDGGGWHQFAIDELGVDWKVGPESSEVFELTAPATPGIYTWYCGICCGGKENPSMQGTLTVEA